MGRTILGKRPHENILGGGGEGPGERGPRGYTGPAGPPGIGGQDGQDGSDGMMGLDGWSAYEVAKYSEHFVGSQVEWLESLKGSDGQDGQDGENGADGADYMSIQSYTTDILPTVASEVKFVYDTTLDCPIYGINNKWYKFSDNSIHVVANNEVVDSTYFYTSTYGTDTATWIENNGNITINGGINQTANLMCFIIHQYLKVVIL